MNNSTLEEVNIRPGVSILSVLRHLNYKPWYALAEFVDNALDSYLKNRELLEKVDGERRCLEVRITIQPGKEDGAICILDNAAGVSAVDYPRAFRAAETPSDVTGLSEFGMGMKSAACWFANKWSVRSSAVGESVERTVTFDMTEIAHNQREALRINTRNQDERAHYTEVVLRQLHQGPIAGRTLGKVREHLASIYRVYLRNGTMKLFIGSDPLQYDDPQVLVAPYYLSMETAPLPWRKEIHFDFGLGVEVSGYAAIRAKGSTSHAGFALFRRGRLIQGSADEAYRPVEIFGTPNRYAYQRIFGELHLEGLPVSHTKDGFQWGEDETAFLELLKEHLDADPLPLLRQAEGHRARKEPKEYSALADQALDATRQAMERPGFAAAWMNLVDAVASDGPTRPDPGPRSKPAFERSFVLNWDGIPWRIDLQLTNDLSIMDWLEVYQQPSGPIGLNDEPGLIGIRLSMNHPFTLNWIGANEENLEAFLRLASALALAEALARYSGVKMAGTIRKNLNLLLAGPLAE